MIYFLIEGIIEGRVCFLRHQANYHIISANLKKVRERRTKWECLILAPYMPGPQTLICQSYQQNSSP
uniref:Uncharacterized protein n=1 Tax=Picea glauca TaxID=3330 RepID=A0A124GMW2_PICGL|nr:hypothetical protein ABT39_MTgene6363 [Picea glauca]